MFAVILAKELVINIVSSCGGEGESKLSGVSSYKGTNPMIRTSPSLPQLNLITSQRPIMLGSQGFSI